MERNKHSLLFFDVLGIKALWQQRGVDRVKRRYRFLDTIVTQSLEFLSSKTRIGLIDGEIDSDSVALVFKRPADAVLAGIAIWLRAFERNERANEDAKLYLRGVIVGTEPNAILRQPVRIKKFSVRRTDYSNTLLDAIAIEKSGFKGMRLLIEESIFSDAEEQSVRSRRESVYQHQGRNVEQWPITVDLGRNSYPGVRRKFVDVAWPVGSQKRMSSRTTRLEARRDGASKEELAVIKASHRLFSQLGST